jgi:RNA polymerase sigma-70 factor (ECF subfamily)
MKLLDGPSQDAPVDIGTGCAGPGRAIRELDQAAEVFSSARPRLFGIAYRILGSINEAEDVVQEVWIRWHGTDRTVVINPEAFLATTTTRLAINVAQSARKRHETNVDRWLLEPVDTRVVDPQTWAERGEAVELAVLLLLEKLTPTERAAYVLRDLFDYPYQQIAVILHLRMANTRQLARRARKRIAAERREPVNGAAHRRFLQAFLAAAQAGNLGDLEVLLAEDATA